ncbi:MAG: MFS transporter [Anaerolineae bacterium]
MRKRHPKIIYYGWYIALALAITTTVGYGVLFYAFSVYITPMEAELGWSRGVLTGGFSLSLLVTGLVAFPVGWWVDRHGARALMTIGSLLAMMLVIAWSQVTDIWAFYAIWIGIGVCSAMVLYEPTFAVIATWFQRRRSAALTLVTFTAGFASTIFLPLADYLLGVFGWRDSVLILGIVLGALMIPLNGLILRRRPQDLGVQPDGDDAPTAENNAEGAPQSVQGITLGDALRSRFFRLLTLAFVLAGFGISSLRVHLIPYLIDVGITPTVAASASGAIGLTQVIGRVLFAPVENQLSKRVLMMVLFTVQTIAVLILLGGASLWIVGAFVLLFGASIGMQTLIRPSVVADTYGALYYGRISSMMALPVTLAFTIGPVFAGFMYDALGNYTVTLWVVAVASTLAIGIAYLTHPHKTK